MFTGLIEAVGVLEKRRADARGGSLRIACGLLREDMHVGDSVAVNGVCLTVTDFDAKGFTADVMPATLKSTTLGHLAPGSPVNLERALRLQDRLGGHLVGGHVDGIARITAMTPAGEALAVRFEVPSELRRYVAQKGSVALDGVSLTVQGVYPEGFEIGLIPHTQAVTALSGWRVGQAVNIECDLMARYLERLMGVDAKENGMTLERLASLGY